MKETILYSLGWKKNPNPRRGLFTYEMSYVQNLENWSLNFEGIFGGNQKPLSTRETWIGRNYQNYVVKF